MMRMNVRLGGFAAETVSVVSSEEVSTVRSI